jgi:hypothetical protein
MKKELEKEFKFISLPGSMPMGGARVLYQERDDTDGVKDSTCVVDRHLALMVRIGLRPAEMAWALDISIDEIDIRLKTLSAQFRGESRSAPSEPDATSAIPVPRSDEFMPGPDHPAGAPVLRQALGALGERVVLAKGEIHLDGKTVNLRDLVIAAAAEGVKIHYPGLRPLPAAFHTGPSKSSGGRRRKSPPSLMSVHFPH